MVQYSGLRRWKDKGAAARAIDRLLALRQGLAGTVTAGSKQRSFHLATWNIRDFGGHRLNPGPRLPESLLYIAEIISAFDLVALQEVNRDMTEFQALTRLLGPNWTCLVSDQSGNEERLAFVYDTRKIQFRHIVGEIVLPNEKKKPVPQFNRTPYLVAFQAGWFKFNICTTHIYYGSASDTKQRIAEIGNLAKFFTKREKQDGETYILLGDFNILNANHATMKALTGNGFTVPKELRDPTALASVNYYDQIALRQSKNVVEIAAAGVFQLQEHVFRDNDQDYAAYKPIMKSRKAAMKDIKAYRKWRTWQMSDHKPLWIEIKTDFTEAYLKSLKPGAEPLADMSEADSKAKRPEGEA